MLRTLPLLFAILLLVQPMHAQESLAVLDDAAVAARRERILDIARAYANHTWSASEKNQHHGKDPDGVQVDTPDTSFSDDGWSNDGSTNTGVPYAWGGFSSLEEFDKGIALGKLAGHIPQGRSAAASRHAVGVDCSGLVSRAWELPSKQSTRSLGEFCYPLDRYEDLQPGDVINKFDAHVMIFVEWIDDARTKMTCIEAITPCVLETERTVKNLKAMGYVPLRFRLIDPRHIESMRVFDHVTFEQDGTAEIVFAADVHADATDITPEELGGLFDDSTAGDWTRYRSASPSEEPAIRSVARGVELDGAIAVHSHLVDDGLTLDTSRDTSASRSLFDSWLHLAVNGPIEIAERELKLCRTHPGRCRVGDREFDASRVVVEIVLTFPAGAGRTIPVHVFIDALISNEVPLERILRADVRTEVHWSADEEPDAFEVRYELLGFGGADA